MLTFLNYSLQTITPYLKHLPAVVGSYRFSYGKVESYYFTRLGPAESLRKTKEICSKFFITPIQYLKTHGTLVSLSGVCQIVFWAQETNLFQTIFSGSTVWACSCWLFLFSHITSLVYFVHIYYVSLEVESLDPELASKLRTQAHWGIGTSLAAIIASVAVILNAGTLLAFILGGIAGLTGCIKVLYDWQIN